MDPTSSSSSQQSRENTKSIFFARLSKKLTSSEQDLLNFFDYQLPTNCWFKKDSELSDQYRHLHTTIEKMQKIPPHSTPISPINSRTKISDLQAIFKQVSASLLEKATVIHQKALKVFTKLGLTWEKEISHTNVFKFLQKISPFVQLIPNFQDHHDPQTYLSLSKEALLASLTSSPSSDSFL